MNAVVISVNRLQAVGEDFTGRTGVRVPSSEGETDTWLSALARLPVGAADVCQARLRAALRAAESMRSLVRRLEKYRDRLARAAAVHSAPLAADLRAFSVLDAALRALDCDLTTTAALQRRWNDTRDWLKDVARLDACLRPVCDKVRVNADTATAYGLRVLTAVFRRLRETPSDVLRLRKLSLLDDDAATRIIAGEVAAADLREREAALLDRIDLKEAARLGAEALDGHASAICDAGIFTRILSSRYKDSLRSTRALCTQTTSNRAVLVDLLRATAQWLRDAGTFRENAALAEMFGAIWQGHTSDLTKLEAARSLLEGLAGLLLPAGMKECLEFLAGVPTPALQAIAAQAQLDKKNDHVLGQIDASLTLPQVQEAAEQLDARLGAAIAAATTAGVSSDSEIRTAEPSTTHLSTSCMLCIARSRCPPRILTFGAGTPGRGKIRIRLP